MQVHLSIGENHRFELREALLVYRDNQSSFITGHDVTARKDAPPTFGSAQPLTIAFIESLVRSLGGAVQAEVLPASVLAKTDRMVVWRSPAQRRQMFYENSEGKAAELNGLVFPQPPLLWRVSNGELNIRALSENKRPEGSTKLAVAPFWNLSDDGRVCTGTMRRPESASVSAIPAWERGFYESAFTHASVGRVDTREARSIIERTLTKSRNRTAYWLDLGNNASSGQFVLGQPLNARNRRKAGRLRTVSELYPEIIDAEVSEDPLPICSAIEALDRQEPFINQTLASSALAMLARLFRYGRLTHHGGFYNAQTNQICGLPVDPQLWSKTRKRQR